MLYVCASIAFFIFAIRSILLWTYIWQKNGYEIGSFFTFLKKLSKWKLVLYSSPYVGFFILVLIYSQVIFSDAFAFWYQLIVTIVINLSVIIFIKEIFTAKIKKPVFSLKALLISLLTTFTVSLFYMVPLVDAYLWMVILLLSIPVFVTLFVALLSFPSELYEDYILQKAKEKISEKPIPYSIALIGNQKEFVGKLLHSLSSSSIVINMPKSKGFLPIIKEIKNGNAGNSEAFVFEIPSSKEEVQKLFSLIRPSVIIATELEDEKDIYKTLFHVTARGIIIFTSPKNIYLIRLLRERKKKVFIYNFQKSSKKGKYTIFGYGLKKKNKNTSFTIHLPKEEFKIVTSLSNEKNFLNILPAVFLVRKLGLPLIQIRKTLEIL